MPESEASLGRDEALRGAADLAMSLLCSSSIQSRLLVANAERARSWIMRRFRERGCVGDVEHFQRTYNFAPYRGALSSCGIRLYSLCERLRLLVPSCRLCYVGWAQVSAGSEVFQNLAARIYD
jgi:hypothetical protein